MNETTQNIKNESKVFDKLAYWAILAYFDVNRGWGDQTS